MIAERLRVRGTRALIEYTHSVPSYLLVLLVRLRRVHSRFIRDKSAHPTWTVVNSVNGAPFRLTCRAILTRRVRTLISRFRRSTATHEGGHLLRRQPRGRRRYRVYGNERVVGENRQQGWRASVPCFSSSSGQWIADSSSLRLNERSATKQAAGRGHGCQSQIDNSRLARRNSSPGLPRGRRTLDNFHWSLAVGQSAARPPRT